MLEILVIVTDKSDQANPITKSFHGEGDASCLLALKDADTAIEAYFQGKADWAAEAPYLYRAEVMDRESVDYEAEQERIKSGRHGQGQ